VQLHAEPHRTVGRVEPAQLALQALSPQASSAPSHAEPALPQDSSQTPELQVTVLSLQL
jgi:hypothetical protein